MKKSFIITAICVSTVFIFQAFTIAPVSNYKNLQILSPDISKAGMDSVMDHFTASLNVKCNYCHVRNSETRKMEFDKDDKPEKGIARKMMLMSIDINKNHFRQLKNEATDKDGNITVDIRNDADKYMLMKVTCYTCHVGSTIPESTPPVKAAQPRPPQAPVK